MAAKKMRCAVHATVDIRVVGPLLMNINTLPETFCSTAQGASTIEQRHQGKRSSQ
jgi:hypothetical protein